MYLPNSEFTYQSREIRDGVRVRINSKGFRDYEYSYGKLKGTFRLLVLGDGFSVGHEVPFELVWHAILERELNIRNPSATNIEVIAAAVPGWSTDQQLLYYRYEGHKFEPDLVILQFTLDDFLSNDTDLLKLGLKTRKPYFVLDRDRLDLRNFPFRGDLYARGSRYGLDRLERLWVRLRSRVRVLRILARLMTRERRNSNPYCQEEELLAYTVDQPPRYQSAWALTRSLLKEVASETTTRGHRFALVYFPERRQSVPDDWQRTLACRSRLRTVQWDRDRPNDLLGGLARQERIPYFDMTPYFRQHVLATGRMLHLQEGHFNPEGHRKAAELLRDWLIRAGLAPGP